VGPLFEDIFLIGKNSFNGEVNIVEAGQPGQQRMVLEHHAAVWTRPGDFALGMALVTYRVVNGVIAVPIMVVMMLLADDHKVMGDFIVTRRLKALGWLATGTMASAVVAMIATW